jgi:hypothetical protein
MPWEKKEDKKAPTYSTVSALAMYKVATAKEEMFGEEGAVENIQFRRMWLKTFSKQIGCIHWSEAEQTVFVGFDQGFIHKIQLTANILAYKDVSIRLSPFTLLCA